MGGPGSDTVRSSPLFIKLFQWQSGAVSCRSDLPGIRVALAAQSQQLSNSRAESADRGESVSKVAGDAPRVVGPRITAAPVGMGPTHEEEIRDRLVKLQSEIFSGATAYDNGVILAGYVAFFALWAGTVKDVSHLCRLLSVALMGGSLLCYVTWHVVQMLTRQRFEWKMSAVFKFAGDPVRFNREWMKTAQEQEIATVRLMRFWPWLFIPALTLGFMAGGVLTYNALAVILGWPQLAN